MHRKFVAYLCCPVTKQELLLTVTEELPNGFIRSGSLVSADGNHIYPIIDGVPRFTPHESYADSFGREWEYFPQVQFQQQSAGGAMSGHTQKMFYSITEWTPEELRGSVVVEFGCGPGRFMDVVKSAQQGDGLVIGLELSRAADVARKNFGEDVNILIVQGDALHAPFIENSFDYTYSIGVLHHTPIPAQGLREMILATKKGKKTALCVYSAKCEFYASPSVYALRYFMNRLKRNRGEKTAYNFALGYAKFAAYFLYYVDKSISKIPVIGLKIIYRLRQYVYVLCALQDTQWRILDTFDAITPTYASTHSPEEIEFWLTQFGCTEFHKTPFAPVSYTAIK